MVNRWGNKNVNSIMRMSQKKKKLCAKLSKNETSIHSIDQQKGWPKLDKIGIMDQKEIIYIYIWSLFVDYVKR